jgi:hypothetical protein
MGNHDDPDILRSVTIDLDGSEARIEKLISKDNEPVKIRISYWYQDRIHSGPMEISETDLVNLLQKAIRAGILTSEFINNLHSDIEI